MRIRIEGLFFAFGFYGFIDPYFLHVGDECDDLGFCEMSHEFFVLEFCLIGEVSTGFDECFRDFHSLVTGVLLDGMFVHRWPWHTEAALHGDAVWQGFEVDFFGEKEAVSRHVGTGRCLAGIPEVIEMPEVVPASTANGIRTFDEWAAFTGEIGTGAF